MKKSILLALLACAAPAVGFPTAASAVTAVTVRYTAPDGTVHEGCHNRQTQTSEPGACATK